MRREERPIVWGREKERERERTLWLLFLYVFSPPWACLMQTGLSQECCSTWSPHSGPQTFSCSVFVGFSLPCLLATAILDSFSLFYLPNTGKDQRQNQKKVTDDGMVGWHHQFNEHEFEQTGKQWRTGKSGVLQFMGLQRVQNNLATELQVFS